MGQLRVLECFAGVGSQSMALRNIGQDFNVVGIMEVDRHALICYSAIHKNMIDDLPAKSDDEMYNYLFKKGVGVNFSTGKNELPKSGDKLRQIYVADIKSNNLGDIRYINPKDVPEHDLMTYSFPCKNISVEGKQDGLKKGGDTQSSLVWECEKIIKHHRPKYLLMENVKNIVSKRHLPAFAEWMDWLEKQGYINYMKIYNSNKFGVPHNRERVLMISIRKDVKGADSFIEPVGNNNTPKLLEVIEKDNIEQFLVDDDYLKGFVEVIDKDKFDILKEQILDNGILYSNKDLQQTIDKRLKYLPLKTQDKDVTVLVREATKLGYKCASIGDSIHITQKNSATRRGRIGKQEVKTLDTVCYQCVVLPNYKFKRLSPLDCWRLQGFTDEDYYKCVDQGISAPKLYERAGRGITVPLLEEIFKNLFRGNNHV